MTFGRYIMDYYDIGRIYLFRTRPYGLGAEGKSLSTARFTINFRYIV